VAKTHGSTGPPGRWPAASLLLLLLLGLGGTSAPHRAGAQGLTLTVPTDYSTIQAAINAAFPGDTVLVLAGTYTENITIYKAITVTSDAGPEATIIDGRGLYTVVRFISGATGAVFSGFTVQNGNGPTQEAGGVQVNDSSPTITGNTIVNNTTQWWGGGIGMARSSPTITGNRILNNHALGGAGIAVLLSSSPTITDNQIIDNTGCQGIGILLSGSSLVQRNLVSNNTTSGCSGGYGGGIHMGGASGARILDNVISNNTITSGTGGGISLNGGGTPTIRGNLIIGNHASGVSPYTAGGGIVMYNDSRPLIVQNIIVGNSAGPAGRGGGVFWLGYGPTLLNNTIVGNDAPLGGSAVYAYASADQTRVVNNILVGNSTQPVIYCEGAPPVFNSNDVVSPEGGGPRYLGTCFDLTGTDGNISADPQFVDAASGNFHLAAGSPAVDAGNNNASGLPATDMDGEPRIVDGDNDGTPRVDMGADEFAILTSISLSATEVSFPPTLIGASSPPQTVTLTNTGEARLYVHLTISGEFSQTNDCEGTAGVAVGNSCAIDIVFSPVSPGDQVGTLTLVDNAPDSPQTVTLTGTGVDSSFSGKVREANQTPVAGATVAAYQGDLLKHSTTTVADGRYTLGVVPGTYDLVASQAGYLDATKTLSINNGQALTGVNFVLFRPSFFLGTVTEKGTGLPLEGALVEALKDGVVVASATTTADGSYSLPVTKGTYQLRATLAGYTTKKKPHQGIGDGKTKSAVDFVLAPLP